MTKNLLIVESPSKAKTLKKYLGNDFEILASYGHVRDLAPKSGAVDPENNFEMRYELASKNKKHLDAIIKAAIKSNNIYLATDPDREGEAISWHLQEILKQNEKLKHIQPQRVTFNEITKSAVTYAIENPRGLSQNLIDAQQTRRALDYLVGFNLSPLLWKKIHRGLSAGRVQSPALRLICEREDARTSFQSKEYWTIHLDSEKDSKSFTAKLFQYKGKKLEQFDIPSKNDNDEIIKNLANKPAIVSDIVKKQRKRKPVAPFSTSTLQQEGVRKLSMTTTKIMKTAQQLYEGIDVGQGAVGLITYMRTDSVSLSNEAITEIRNYIQQNMDAQYLPKSPNIYKTKTKNAQEAHEAIRPTSIERTPESVKPFLTSDQFKLYQMVWKRTLASQMSEAKFHTTTVDISIEDSILKTYGNIMIFNGFLSVYEESQDEPKDENKLLLPDLKINEEIFVNKLYGEQHFTQPPPRYTEASLVKALEEFGIGRPSTYASIISTLKNRDYVQVNQKQFIPTDRGEIVNKFLTQHFDHYVDYNFTAKMENDLDSIANGDKKWLPIMRAFWKNFSQQVEEKENISRKDVTTEDLDEVCPKCKKHKLQVKFGRRGRFIACSGYPDCDYTRNIDQTKEDKARELEIVEGRTCPECESQLIYKMGPYGRFIGCSNYPKCKYIEPLNKPRDTGIVCPVCNQGTLLEKKSRYGKSFFGCSHYPKCNYAVWNEPIKENCPKCNWPILTIKVSKRRGTEKVCPQKECGYSEPFEDENINKT
ncbi:MAG: type I DNA topoisomerase [Neisseriaceae bacterium]|nr:MAG: type I DNA topoisomerase [Neisseriaceae bacterium]